MPAQQHQHFRHVTYSNALTVMLRTSQPGKTGLGPHTPSTCAGMYNKLLELLLLLLLTVKFQKNDCTGPQEIGSYVKVLHFLHSLWSNASCMHEQNTPLTHSCSWRECSEAAQTLHLITSGMLHMARAAGCTLTHPEAAM